MLSEDVRAAFLALFVHDGIQASLSRHQVGHRIRSASDLMQRRPLRKLPSAGIEYASCNRV